MKTERLKMKTETDLEMVRVGSELDFRLAELLGENHLDCLVLYFDGKEAPWVGGTPPNTLMNRLQRLDAVNKLNKHGKQWRDFFPEWARMFREKMGLPETATAENYRPKIGLKVHRVVAGYSQHLSAAVKLLENEKVKKHVLKWRLEDVPLSNGPPQGDLILWLVDGSVIHAGRRSTAAEAIAHGVGQLLSEGLVKDRG